LLGGDPAGKNNKGESSMYYALVAFCSTLLFLGALRRAAHRFGLVDRPSVRKTHLGEIPVVGGLAIGAAFLTTLFIEAPLSPPLMPFAVACIIALATGLFDDLKEFSARGKFVGQLAAAVIMTSWGNLFLVDLGNLWGTGDVILGNWAIPFTLFCVIGIMNAMNMIDGLDGLASGIGLIAAAWLAVAASICGLFNAAQLLVVFVAAIAAFLLFNLRHPWRRHAAVFLGDAGSMFLGFILVWFTVKISQAAPRDFYAISAVWILGVPIMDTVYVMLRRLVRGISPFAADRRHVHHTLIYIGLSETSTSWFLLAVSFLFGGIGFLGWLYGVPEYVLTYAFLGVFAWHCAFMQYWRAIFRFLGIRHVKVRVQPALAPVVIEPIVDPAAKAKVLAK
jgi:UDP-GlcNAc:undecaprenyl-phosphate/decaprenyl-phosphate GlcNAc-1-phosphate transferase